MAQQDGTAPVRGEKDSTTGSNGLGKSDRSVTKSAKTVESPRSLTIPQWLQSAIKGPWVPLCIVVIVAVLVLVLRTTLVEADRATDRSSLNNLSLFLFINLNIILVIILGFLVVKNIARLMVERRAGIFGARIRTRLVSAFVGLALVPSILLFFVSKGMLDSVLRNWFSPQVEGTFEGSLAVVTETYYRKSEQDLERVVKSVASRAGQVIDLASKVPGGSDEKDRAVGDSMRELLALKLEEHGLTEVVVLKFPGTVVAESRDAEFEEKEIQIPGPHLQSVKNAHAGIIAVRPERSLTGEFLRAYAPVPLASPDTSTTDDPTPSEYIVIATEWIPSTVSAAIGRVLDSYDDYQELAAYRRPLASGYILTLVMVTLLVIFTALWVGFYLARTFSGPIQMLAAGTQEVARGNFELQLPDRGNDEFGVLVRSFNSMTSDLRRMASELEERRKYMETVLESLSVGVISLDQNNHITTCNRAAGTILGMPDVKKLVGCATEDVFPEAVVSAVVSATNDASLRAERRVFENVALSLGGNLRHLQVTVTPLLSENGVLSGSVVLVEDLTELVHAQRMAAWREVARRIAHEIKNPLTPIQLSAQRIQRRFTEDKGDGLAREDLATIVSECTNVIVEQVEILRNLVNEFSRFARMPKAQLRPDDLHSVVNSILAIFREAHSDIDFQADLDVNVPIFFLDKEQMTRVLTNLLDNAVSAIHCLPKAADLPVDGMKLGSVVVSTRFDGELQMVSLTVSDTGCGVSGPDKGRLFEPYFSTKKGGTGLGLAIVSAIIADHHGFIRVRDNVPRGTSFTVELPTASLLHRAQQQALS